MGARRVGEHLDSYVWSIHGLGEMNQLVAHDRWPADGASQDGFVEHEPKPQRRARPFEDSLTSQAQVNPARDVHFCLLRADRAKQTSGIVGGLEETMNRLRLEDVERLRLRLETDIGAQRRREYVAVLLPPALL